MNFSEYQDGILAAGVKPCCIELGDTAEELTEDIYYSKKGETLNIDKTAKDLGVILRHLAAIATDLELDLGEVAEASLKQITNGEKKW